MIFVVMEFLHNSLRDKRCVNKVRDASRALPIEVSRRCCQLAVDRARGGAAEPLSRSCGGEVQ